MATAPLNRADVVATKVPWSVPWKKLFTGSKPLLVRDYFIICIILDRLRILFYLNFFSVKPDDFDDPCTFAEIGINCWIMNNSKQPLEPEKARQPSPLIRTTVEDKVKKQFSSSSRGRQTSWTEKAKAIKASIDKYESKIIPEYRETRKKQEDMALKNILHTLMMKNNDLMKNNIKRMEDEAIVEYKISPAKKLDPQGEQNFIHLLRNAPEPETEDSSSLVLKKLLGIPC